VPCRLLQKQRCHGRGREFESRRPSSPVRAEIVRTNSHFEYAGFEERADFIPALAIFALRTI